MIRLVATIIKYPQKTKYKRNPKKITPNLKKKKKKKTTFFYTGFFFFFVNQRKVLRGKTYVQRKNIS